MVSIFDKIAAEHENIMQVLAEIEKVKDRSEKEMVVLVGLGAYINNVYNGIENILKQVILSKNINLDQTSTWHKELLAKARQLDIIDEKTADRIGKYLFFRHFFTHSYGFLIDEDKLKPLIESIHSDYAQFKMQVDRFISNSQ